MRISKHHRLVLVAILLIVLSALSTVVPALAQTDNRPNIIFIIPDDMGYSDLGAYGSEISTPNLDQLVSEGVMFTNFHTGTTCSPSRSMLLTGLDNHRAGFGNMAGFIRSTPTQQGKPSYLGYLTPAAATISEILQTNGYNTFMTGKWHLGEADGLLPVDRGFTESFSLLNGGATHYNEMIQYNTKRRPAEYIRNDQIIEELPEDFYSTDAFIDSQIEWIEQYRATGKPFFSYIALQAPHSPMQAPEEYIAKYKGMYDAGWDEMRIQRFNRVKELGLVADYIQMGERWDFVPAWDTLTPEEKAEAARTMEVYAAMVEYVDYKTGILIEYLKSIGEYDNTIFVYMTDNGADGTESAAPNGHYNWVYEQPDIDNNLENIGLRGSFRSLVAGWAQMQATPYRGGKSSLYEGGYHGEFAITWRGGNLPAGTRNHHFATVMDIVPTLLDMLAIPHPGGTEYNGRMVLEVDGRSMVPMLTGGAPYLYGPDEPVGFEYAGNTNKSLHLGDWKALIVGDHPYGHDDSRWELYNLAVDPVEQNNLADEYPQLLAQMIALHAEYEQRVGFVSARPEIIPFTPENWTFEAEVAEVVDFEGKQALKMQAGRATFNNATLPNGIIQFSVAFDSMNPAFVGAFFRSANGSEERLTLTPHNSGNTSSVQYSPILNGLGNFQLYDGIGFNGVRNFVPNRYTPVKIVISNAQASFYVADLKEEVIAATTLRVPANTDGTFGLFVGNQAPGSVAYFANFSFIPMQRPPTLGEGSAEEQVVIELPANAIAEWQVSAPFAETDLAGVMQLDMAMVNSKTYTALPVEVSGLANFGTLSGLQNGNTVFARTTLIADQATTRTLKFGYSDRAKVYLNGMLVYSGDNTYVSATEQNRINYGEMVVLPLIAGNNDLVIAVSETSGGWGLQALVE